MGVNAQIEVPAFTAGQVLTAAEMTQINTGIPVFATTVTRDAAFGGTGEKTLAEGQFAYIEATDTTQYYNGSAWVAVGVTPMARVITPTSVAVGSGSATINAGGSVTWTGASSVSLNGVFSSSYTNYLAIVNLTATSTEQNFSMRLRAAGTDTSSSTYRRYRIALTSGASGTQTTTTSMEIGGFNSTYITGSGFQMTFYGPNVANRTAFQSISQQADSNNDQSVQIATGSQSDSTQFDGFTLFVGGTFAGTVTVYGYSI
jgi:hypothetical protein